MGSCVPQHEYFGCRTDYYANVRVNCISRNSSGLLAEGCHVKPKGVGSTPALDYFHCVR